jgi:hypothetical protein
MDDIYRAGKGLARRIRAAFLVFGLLFLPFLCLDAREIPAPCIHSIAYVSNAYNDRMTRLK